MNKSRTLGGFGILLTFPKERKKKNIQQINENETTLTKQGMNEAKIKV